MGLRAQSSLGRARSGDCGRSRFVCAAVHITKEVQMRKAITLGVLVLSSSVSSAVVSVGVNPSGDPHAYATVTQTGLTTYTVELVVESAFAGSSASFAIGGATTDTIESITVRADSAAPVSFTIGSTSAFVGSVGDIDIGTSTSHVTLTEGRVLNNLGSMRIHKVTFLQVNGQILGDITCESHTSGVSDLLSLRSGSVATPGGIFGDITVEHGKADFISVFGGDIGTPTSPVTIRVRDDIGSIDADAVYASIGAPTGATVRPRIRRLAANAGPIVGDLHVRSFQLLTGQNTAGIYALAGDLDADVIIAENTTAGGFRVSGGVFPDGRILRIGGSLSNPPVQGFNGAIELPANGLQGQIIVNASNGGGSWVGNVVVGTTTLVPEPDYTQTSASIGGGAVGQVRFRLHDEDCSPANTPSSPPEILNSKFCGRIAGQEEYITLRFYGPVRVDHTSASPVTIRADGTPSVLSERATAAFLTRSSTGAASREVEIRGSNLRRLLPGVYRIRPVTTASDDGVYSLRPLLCDDTLVEPNPPLVTDFEYVFELLSDCNDNGIDDVTEIAQNPSLDLFPGDGCIDYCYSGTCGLDYNGDGNVDQDDFQCLAQAVGGTLTCLAVGADPDFNQDGNVDQDDVLALGSTIAGDPCPW
ncbi:MAG: hypothetical protein SFY69_01715 [Planctomycetota bacterium]|nr:hypothetical protein [Planctomycetota bacterium]